MRTLTGIPTPRARGMLGMTGLLVAVLLVFGGLHAPAYAQDADAVEDIDAPDVTLFVDGMSCPFCQYGIERHLKRIDAVAEIAVDIQDARIDITLKDGTTLTEEEIQQAIDDAGFTLRDVKFADARAGTTR